MSELTNQPFVSAVSAVPGQAPNNWVVVEPANQAYSLGVVQVPLKCTIMPLIGVAVAVGGRVLVGIAVLVAVGTAVLVGKAVLVGRAVLVGSAVGVKVSVLFGSGVLVAVAVAAGAWVFVTNGVKVAVALPAEMFTLAWLTTLSATPPLANARVMRSPLILSTKGELMVAPVAWKVTEATPKLPLGRLVVTPDIKVSRPLTLSIER